MARPKPYGDFFIYGSKMDLPVYISFNKLSGRLGYFNKYILNLKSLVDANEIGADELLKIRKKIADLSTVRSAVLNTDTTIDVILSSGGDWKDGNAGNTTGDVIKKIIQDEVSAKIQQSTSTTTQSTTAVPNTPPYVPLKIWNNYYVLPKTGIQIFEEKNISNVYRFSLPQSKMDEKDIKLFLDWMSVRTLTAGTAKLDGDNWVIEFQFYNVSVFPPIPKPTPLTLQEQEFKKIDNQLISKHGFKDYTVDDKRITIDDIKALEPNDIVKVKSKSAKFEISIVIEQRTSQENNMGYLGTMIDINEGTVAENIFYPDDWFIDPDYEIQITKGGAKDIATPAPKVPLIEEDLQRAKKELSQLLILKSFTSPIEFERKIEINQKMSDVQKRINDLNFKILEQKLSKDDIFEDLFEQSFTPINNTYSDVFAASSSGSGEVASADFFAPDGSPSKLSDSLNELIRTPQFLEWFGNWQLAYAYKDTDAVDISCSKVVTKDYEPLVVWHGTGQQFSYFRFDNFPAAYFAVNWKYSKWFADLHGGGSGYTIPFFLNVRNPLDLTRFETRKIKAKEFFDYIYLMTGMTMVDLEVNPLFMDTNAPAVETWVYLRNNAKMLKKLSESHVFDGIHFYETNPNVPEGESAHRTEAYITFRAEQCKVADPNRGLLLFASLKSFLLKQGGKI